MGGRLELGWQNASNAFKEHLPATPKRGGEQKMSMSQTVCGVDVHRDLLVATIIQSDQSKETRRFVNEANDINSLKNWLKTHECKRAVMESTSIYWVPLYLALEEAGFDAVLANAHQVKAIPGRKTDQSSSEWLAHLLQGGQIKPSYVPQKQVRELRELTRLRVKLVENRTAFKNRCQKVLNRVNIRLGSRLSDVFGKAGKEILEGLMAGKTVESILEQTQNKWLKNRCDEIKAVAKGALSESDIFVLKELTEMIEHLNEKIRRVEARVETLVDEQDVAVVSSVSGVGRRSAAAILAEIGDAKRFSDGKQIASWTGLAPSVYQSAGTFVTGHITKQGSKWLRRVMVEVAHAAVKKRDSRFRMFYLRVKAKKGEKTAIVAVARKMLTIIWHLLMKGEKFVEEGFEKTVKSMKAAYAGHVPLEEMAEILRRAGYGVSGPYG
jgi:transposase